METDMWSIQNIATKEILPISKSVFRVGRNINADLTSLTNSLSRNHATLSILIDGLLYLQDNNSCNGTFINNRKIQSMEMKLINEGDIIGFGCSQDFCKDGNFDSTPLIFRVLKKNTESERTVINQSVEQPVKQSVEQPVKQPVEQPVEQPVQTNKDEFSLIPDCIVISDDEDEANIFCNSQIFKISEKIKSEQITLNESVDPYYNIKQELEDLDFCDNQYVVDLTDDQSYFEKTSDLLDILESPVQASRHQILNMGHAPCKKEYKKPPIIEPHFDKKMSKKDKDETITESSTSKNSDKVGNTKSKRKNSISSPHVKKKPKKTNVLESRCDKKSIANEFKKRSLCNNPSVQKKCNSENKIAIQEERKKKLKEIANSNENPHNSKVKPIKHLAKVKNSGSRGNFLLEGCSNKQKSVHSTESYPSTSKSTIKTNIKIQTEERKLQDTTITSNFSPTVDVEKLDNLVKVPTHTSPDCQKPDSTFVENRSGIIWKTALNSFSSSVIKSIPRNISIDEVICKILYWSVKWLLEQNNIDRSPPVNGDVQPKKMPLNFKSFSEYVDTVTTLAMLELWQYIYQMLYNKDEERLPIKIFLNHKRIVGNLMYLDCECYLTEENVKNGNIPRTDDFALIELKLKDSMNSYMYTGFAYIKFCKRKYLKEHMQIDNHVASLCTGIPVVSLTFSIMTRNLINKEIVGKQIMMKVIANISSSLKLLKSVKYLETSPIGRTILCPKIEDFKVPSDSEKNILEVHLNKEQKQIVLEASSLCLGNIPRLYLIKGPPGTGKSTVIVNIVLQILFRSIKYNTKEPPLILLTAPSNAAIDGLILKLGETRKKLPEAERKHLKMIRLGPDASISASVDKFKLSSLAQSHILREHGLTSSEKYKDALNNGTGIDNFLRNHFGHSYNYEMKCAEDVLLFRSNVICTTLSSSVGPRIIEGKRKGRLKFSCCIIDEATQCTEPESLLPIQLGIDKIVLVGDPQQLPAVVCNREAQNLRYGRSLFSRIDENFMNNVDSPVRMLCEQYRMKHEICEYPNKTFYNGKLKSLPVYNNPILPELRPYLLFNLLNSESDEGSPYINSQEVELICSLLETLKISIEVRCKYTIGIITPYRAQKDLLLKRISRVKFNNNVSTTVNTVDSFQGMENDVIIISCVRFAPNYFLQNEQRLNVALTRARQALYIIGNYSLFKHCQLLYDLREDAKRRRLCIDIKESSTNINFSKYIFKM